MAASRDNIVLNTATAKALKLISMYSFSSIFLNKVSGDTYRLSTSSAFKFGFFLVFPLGLKVFNIYLLLSLVWDSVHNTSSATGIKNNVSLASVSITISINLLIMIVALIGARKQLKYLINLLAKIQKITPQKQYYCNLNTASRQVKKYFTWSIVCLIVLTVIDVTIMYTSRTVSRTLTGLCCCAASKKTRKKVFLMTYVENKEYLYDRSHLNSRKLSRAYLSVCELVVYTNKYGSTVLFMLLAVESVDNFCIVYYLTESLQFTDTLIGTIQVIIQATWLFYVSIRLFLRIENGHCLNKEICNINEVLCKILNKLPNNREHEEIRILFEQITILQVQYAPLEIIPLNRALIASIIGALMTFLLIILQFNIKNLNE